MALNWDDLRFVLALSRAGSLARAAKDLKVDHTTVGRRIEAIEADLGVRLFTRGTTGYVPTAEAERLWPEIRSVEEAVLALERRTHAELGSLEGVVRVTAPETFGAWYLAPRLAQFSRLHPGLSVDLVIGGEVLDLARRQADIAVRLFRSNHESLIVRRAGEVTHALYAAKDYLLRQPLASQAELARHPILAATPGPNVIEAIWLERLTRGARPIFVTNLTLGLLAAAREGAGIAVLPRYIGDAEPSLARLPMPDEPREPIWVTVHRDVRQAPRVRAVLEYLNQRLKQDARLLSGR